VGVYKYDRPKEARDKIGEDTMGRVLRIFAIDVARRWSPGRASCKGIFGVDTAAIDCRPSARMGVRFGWKSSIFPKWRGR
jgi:hypothetical protein